MLEAITRVVIYGTGACLILIMLYSMRPDVVMSVVQPQPTAAEPITLCSATQTLWYPAVQTALAQRLHGIGELMDFDAKIGPPDDGGLHKITIHYHLANPARAKVYTATGTLADKDCITAITTIER